ncbi:putative metal-dependent protease of the PAD1/JAB1 superfamily [Rivularia sp. PCC 7116]|uniref:Mov34/MPN/PAD-1 family protein n=1 Tax=Rivularia sp. PCC 7116 TaxID=373994 RepID=UPI00029F1117|nr:M67 family metallopeptidase [Rivularia sp. PCC 7116]AFY55951.1 putative metal-dependent protease of the PAD1/JAB1 superfamily [Rivularia sp. PCC 7116]
MIRLNKHHLQIINNHAESAYPDECCGVVLGSISCDSKIVVEVIPTQNAWDSYAADDFSGSDSDRSKKRRYTIAPREMLQLQKTARERNLDIIGIFHSHPDYPAIPSEFDRKYAWQEYSYIIVSVQKGQPTDVFSWVLDDNSQFQQEEIRVEEKV